MKSEEEKMQRQMNQRENYLSLIFLSTNQTKLDNGPKATFSLNCFLRDRLCNFSILALPFTLSPNLNPVLALKHH